MAYEITAEQIKAISELPASQRYTHFLSSVVEHQELWTLKSDKGFALYNTDDNKEVIPLWPHPRYAQSVKKLGWLNCTPFKIALNDFMTRWIPGMAQDERLAGIFPSSHEEGIIVNSRALSIDLREALKKFRNLQSGN